MSLEIILLSRELSLRHGVIWPGILTMSNRPSARRARHAIWVELYRRGHSITQIAEAWACDFHTVSVAMDAPSRGAPW